MSPLPSHINPGNHAAFTVVSKFPVNQPQTSHVHVQSAPILSPFSTVQLCKRTMLESLFPWFLPMFSVCVQRERSFTSRLLQGKKMSIDVHVDVHGARS